MNDTTQSSATTGHPAEHSNIVDWDAVRARYPAAQGITYLNTASRGLLSARVRDAGLAYYQALYDDAGAALSGRWLGALESARASVAAMIGASSETIAFVSNASSAINLGADLIGAPGEVLVHAEEFPSVSLPWQQRGHSVRYIEPAADGPVDVEAYAGAVSRDTRYIAVSAVQFASGYRVDLRALREICDRHDLFLVVDATQAAGCVALDVGEFDPDVLTFSSYKWLCAGYGVATMYVAPRLLERRPLPDVGWRSTSDPYGLCNRDAELSQHASALELGNPVMPGPLVLAESVRELSEIGIDRIAQRVLALNDRLHRGLDARGIELRSPREPARRAGITMIALDDADAAVRSLSKHAVHTSARAGRIRISPHLYSDEGDIDRLLAALDELGDGARISSSG